MPEHFILHIICHVQIFRNLIDVCTICIINTECNTSVLRLVENQCYMLCFSFVLSGSVRLSVDNTLLIVCNPSCVNWWIITLIIHSAKKSQMSDIVDHRRWQQYTPPQNTGNIKEETMHLWILRITLICFLSFYVAWSSYQHGDKKQNSSHKPFMKHISILIK